MAHWRPLDQDQDQDQERLADVRVEAPPIEPVESRPEQVGDPFDDLPPEEPDPWADPPAAGDAPAPKSAKDGRAGRRLPVPDGDFSLAPAPPQESDTPTEPPKESEGDETPDEEAAEPKPRFEVLTAYSSRLNGLARAWPEAAAQLFLSGGRLRLWVAAAGEPVTGGYALGLDPGKDLAAIDAALVRAGLAGRLSDDGRHYRIMGKRRVRRLAELVGERPAAAPEEMWPSGAGA
nr:hypothetical protein [Actinoplanes durhamensis]